MKQKSREHIKGLMLLIPLLLTAIGLVIIATPKKRYSEIKESYDTSAEELTTDSDTTILHPFDPNNDNYRTLIEAGVPRNIAVGIIRWREAGKTYRIKEDLALCYQMTDSLYFTLEPYIVIGEEYRLKPAAGYDNRATTTTLKARDTLVAVPHFLIDTASAKFLRTLGFSVRQAELVVRYRDMIGGYRSFEEFEECYAVDSVMAKHLKPYIIFPTPEIAQTAKESFPIEINSADSAALVRISGIGPKSAAQIIKYRELLGGYYNVDQISELEVVTEENFQRILPQICCDSAEIKKININFASPKLLERHPYLSNRMLRRIINKRELKGGWSTIQEMIEDDIFSEEEAARIAPYLDFGTPSQ